jgi:signal transduction histidine kinase
MAPGRLEEAAREGRLGVHASVRGRLADVGGTVAVHSAPGQGTEVELVLPKQPSPAPKTPSVSAKASSASPKSSSALPRGATR